MKGKGASLPRGTEGGAAGARTQRRSNLSPEDRGSVRFVCLQRKMLAGCKRGRDVSRWQGRDKCQARRELPCQLTTGGETYTDGQVVGASCRERGEARTCLSCAETALGEKGLNPSDIARSLPVRGQPESTQY